MEQTQLRIFSGETELRTPIGAVFLRYHPVDRADRIAGTLTEEPVSASSLRRAQAIFEEEIGKSFGIELADLSRERWSLVPPVSDFLAEIRTKGRFGTLTYVRSGGEPEDISLFQRARKPQHRRLRLGAPPAGARLARVQRGRRSRLRRLALLHRRDDRSRSPADRRPHRDAADRALARRQHADVQAGRIAERVRRRRPGAGPAARAARPRPERGAGQPAADAGPRHDDHAHDRLRRPPRRRVGGSRGGRACSRTRRSTRSSRSPPNRACSTAIAATGTRRRRSPTTPPACCG